MAGALLRSGSVKDFYPLGAVGNPVYSAASQLRAAMRRQLGQPVADLFAIPKQDEQGDTIDWYAPVEGNVIPWSAATAEERAHAKTTLLTAREQLAGRSQALQVVNDSEQQVFGKLLALAMRIPSDEHIYLVNGHPVLSFWGFTERDAPPDRDVISGLQVGTPLAPATGSTTLAGGSRLCAKERLRRRFWWWLLPLLLLLLLLLLALFGLRGCESDAIPPWVLKWFEQKPIKTAEPVPAEECWQILQRIENRPERDKGQLLQDNKLLIECQQLLQTDPQWIERYKKINTLQAEECWQILQRIENRAERDKGQLLQDKKVLIECQQLLQTDPQWIERYKKFIAIENIDGGGGPGPAGQELVEKSDDLPEPDPDPVQSDTPPPDPTLPDTTPLDEPPQPAENGDVPSPTDEPKPVDQGGKTPLPPDTTSGPPDQNQSGSKLVIPDEAIDEGSTEFLDGQWKSTSNLQGPDGLPIQVEYDLKGGQGTAKLLLKGPGGQEQTCTAPVQATMKGGNLVIDEQQAVVCPDGTNLGRYHVECLNDSTGQAKCKGTNPDGSGSGYDVNLVKK